MGQKCKKDHKCNACEKEFSPASMFKSHIKSINNGQKDKCDTCGKGFSGSEYHDMWRSTLI